MSRTDEKSVTRPSMLSPCPGHEMRRTRLARMEACGVLIASLLLSINVIVVAGRFPDPPVARPGGLVPEVSVVAASRADAAAESR